MFNEDFWFYEQCFKNDKEEEADYTEDDYAWFLICERKNMAGGDEE